MASRTKPPSPPPKPFIELRDVSLRYGAINALTKVSFSVYPGEVLAVVGERGSGKSSLGRIICGLARISGGSMRCEGVECVRYTTDKARAMKIEYVSDASALFPRLSVAANLSIHNPVILPPPLSSSGRGRACRLSASSVSIPSRSRAS